VLNSIRLGRIGQPACTEQELGQYFLHLTQVRRYARATVTIALCGITFFFAQTLQKTWTSLSLMPPPRERKLPVVLSREDVRRILRLVRLPVYRVCLITIDVCGLRLLEGARLQTKDIDRARLLLQPPVRVPSRGAPIR
jgi:integrase